MINQPYFNALILGYTGAVGSALLTELIKSDKVQSVICLGRNAPAYDHHKIQFVQADLTRMTNHMDAFSGVSRVYCCLGTTIKKAGSKAAFKSVDYNMVVDAGLVAKQAGVQHFSVISAVGANSNSLFYYNRVKGDMEKSLQDIELPRLTIYRPGLLLGDRKESRFGEKVAAAVLPLIEFMMPANTRSIGIDIVAKAMLLNSIKVDEGLDICFYKEMKQLANSL